MSPDDVLWTRIVTNMASSAGFLMVAMFFGWLLLHWKTVGHRLLLSTATGFCTIHAVVSAVAAYDVCFGGQTATLVGRVVSAALLLVFATHLIVSNHDVLRTLSTSEAENIKRLDRLIDQEHARLLLQYADMQTRMQSEQLVCDLEAGWDA